MLEFQCWFCGEGIDRDDDGALLVSIGNLWRHTAGLRGNDGPFQNLYIHSRCAEGRLAGASMNFDPSDFCEND